MTNISKHKERSKRLDDQRGAYALKIELLRKLVSQCEKLGYLEAREVFADRLKAAIFYAKFILGKWV